MLARLRRLGFSLAEILVALLIIAVMAAIIVPAVGSRLRQAQATAVADNLTNLGSGIAAYRQNVLKYPFTLDILTTQPTAASKDICGNNMVAANFNKWQGPYMTRPILGDFPAGDATVKNQLVRVPASGAGVGTLQIQVDLVDSTAWLLLEAQYDGNADSTTGSIIWTRTAPNVGKLTYSIPIRGC